MTSADVAGEPEGGGTPTARPTRAAPTARSARRTPTARPAGADFAWMTGFECSIFPQVGMDELALTQDPPEITPHASGYRLGRIPTASLDAWRRYATSSPETTVGPLARLSTNEGIPLW